MKNKELKESIANMKAYNRKIELFFIPLVLSICFSITLGLSGKKATEYNLVSNPPDLSFIQETVEDSMNIDSSNFSINEKGEVVIKKEYLDSISSFEGFDQGGQYRYPHERIKVLTDIPIHFKSIKENVNDDTIITALYYGKNTKGEYILDEIYKTTYFNVVNETEYKKLQEQKIKTNEKESYYEYSSGSKENFRLTQSYSSGAIIDAKKIDKLETKKTALNVIGVLLNTMLIIFVLLIFNVLTQNPVLARQPDNSTEIFKKFFKIYKRKSSKKEIKSNLSKHLKEEIVRQKLIAKETQKNYNKKVQTNHNKENKNIIIENE